VCPIHGPFEQEAHSHLKGQGCPKCGIESRSRKRSDTKETFIEKARKVHGDKYDYSKVKYVNGKTKVTIICPEHGEFEQMPSSHIKGHGCVKCGFEMIRNARKSGAKQK
jgi:Zn ribbon nucleic-acid-binding protein